MKIVLEHITKRFGKEEILYDVNYTFTAPSATALLGYNGSGKSTLLQIIAGFVSPTKGKLTAYHAQHAIQASDLFTEISICAPYLELIEEMTLTEFLAYHFDAKKPLMPIGKMIELMGLTDAAHKQIQYFSSGMKQRVKLAQAIFADTAVLLLDEPCSNLDEAGIAQYHKWIETYATNKIVVIASNDPDEYGFCTTHIQTQAFKRQINGAK